MLYEPGDPDKIVHAVIALDTAFCAICEHLGQSHVPLAHELSPVLGKLSEQVYEHFSAEDAAGISDKLRQWKSLLSGAPNPSGH